MASKNKSCLVKAHTAGLWSLVNHVITQLGKYDHVSADWHGTLYGPEEDLWPRLFQPLPKIHPPFDTAEIYEDQWLTAKHAATQYQKRSTGWRHDCNKQWRKLTVLEDILGRAWTLANRFRDHRTVAVQIRATTHAGEQITNASQPLELYADAISSNLLPGDFLYVAASDEESLDWIASKFYRHTVLWHPLVHRSSSRDYDYHLTVKQTWEDAARCLEEVLILASADTLIHPVSNMATGALYINPSLKSVYLP